MMLIWLVLLLNQEVINGMEPVDGSKKLVAELRLGGDDNGEDQIFSGTTTLAVDAGGMMYVNDPKAWQIKVFDPSGKLTRRFGRKGAGPGEFNEPVAIASGPDGKIYVFDAGHKKMIVFEKDGDFHREARFPDAIQGVYQPVVLEGGQVAFMAFRNNEIPWTYNTSLYDKDMNVIKVLEKIILPNLDFQKANEPGFWTDFLEVHLETAMKGMPMLAQLNKKQLVSARASSYQCRIIDGKGNVISSFSNKYKPAIMSEDARYSFCETVWEDLTENPFLTPLLTESVFRKAMDKADLPPGLLPIAAMAHFGQGVAVLSGYDPARQNGKLDFFDQGGQYIAAAPFEGSCKSMYGTKKHLYIVGADESDSLTITRFRVE